MFYIYYRNQVRDQQNRKETDSNSMPITSVVVTIREENDNVKNCLKDKPICEEVHISVKSPENNNLLNNNSNISNDNSEIGVVVTRLKKSTKNDSITSATSASSTQSSGASTITNNKRTSTVFGKVSKYRHLKGTVGHKSTHIENIRNLSRQLPAECNGFTANNERVAVPLSGPGGKIAIFELNRPGRLPDGVIPSLVNGTNIMDFQWDPFNKQRLAVACDDGVVRLWHIDENGLKEPTNKSTSELMAHNDKIYFIRFHPLAKDILLTASYDMTVKIWNLEKLSEEYTLTGHTDQIYDWAWSPCGKYGVTVCKDGKMRIYDPRKSCQPILEGVGVIGSRSSRVLWALEGQFIVCTGFNK